MVVWWLLFGSHSSTYLEVRNFMVCLALPSCFGDMIDWFPLSLLLEANLYLGLITGECRRLILILGNETM